MDNSINNNGSIGPSSPRLHPREPEGASSASTASNVHQVQVNTASSQLTQEIQNARSIISAVKSPEDRALMETILDKETNPQVLIKTAGQIKDKKTQQRAWLIIATNPLLDTRGRVDAALRLGSSKVKNNILKAILLDPNVEAYIKMDIAEGLANDLVMQQKAYYIIATHQQKNSHYSLRAAERIVDPEKQQEAFILLANLPPIEGFINDQAGAVCQIKDLEQKQRLCFHIVNHTHCETFNINELIQLVELLEDEVEKENCAIKVLNSISFWDAEIAGIWDIENSLGIFHRLYNCITPDRQEEILAQMITNDQVPQEFRREVILLYIPVENQTALLDGIENGFKKAKSSRKL